MATEEEIQKQLKEAQKKLRLDFTEKRNLMERMDETSKKLHEFEQKRKDKELEVTHQIKLDLKEIIFLSDKAAARIATLPMFGAPGTTITTGGPLPGIPLGNAPETAPSSGILEWAGWDVLPDFLDWVVGYQPMATLPENYAIAPKPNVTIIVEGNINGIDSEAVAESMKDMIDENDGGF